MGDLLPLSGDGAGTGGDSISSHPKATTGSGRPRHPAVEHQLRSTRVCVAAAGAGHTSRSSVYTADGSAGFRTAATTGASESGFVKSSSDGVQDA